MAHGKWKEIKQQPGTARPGNMLGCCLLSFHFLWAIHPIEYFITFSKRLVGLDLGPDIRYNAALK